MEQLLTEMLRPEAKLNFDYCFHSFPMSNASAVPVVTISKIISQILLSPITSHHYHLCVSQHHSCICNMYVNRLNYSSCFSCYQFVCFQTSLKVTLLNHKLVHFTPPHKTLHWIQLEWNPKLSSKAYSVVHDLALSVFQACFLPLSILISLSAYRGFLLSLLIQHVSFNLPSLFSH